MNNYDVIIAGAGIVGLASALKTLEKLRDAKLLLLEKEDSIARHQSGNNSNVIHSGIYYKPGTLKAKNCVNGYRHLLEFCEKENVRYDICGKVIVAVNERDLPYLDILYDRGIANGLNKIRKISREELKELEPFANGIRAIHVPYTGIVDFKSICGKFAELIKAQGTEIKFCEKVVDLALADRCSEVTTVKNTYRCKVFVNCCGLQSDEIAALSGAAKNTRIVPFRGEYYKLKKDKEFLVNSLIYPVPNPDFPFLGVHFTKMINGGVEAGPNAVFSFKKEGYKKLSFSFKDSIRTFTWGGFRKIALKYYKVGAGEFYRSFNKNAFVKALQRLLPEVTKDDLEPGGAGVRAQAIDANGKLVDDFVIEKAGNVINVINAPSPAATSSLSIGETIANEIISKLKN
jgi:L-2-hydroxyglutarate oxidase